MRFKSEANEVAELSVSTMMLDFVRCDTVTQCMHVFKF